MSIYPMVLWAKSVLKCISNKKHTWNKNIKKHAFIEKKA